MKYFDKINLTAFAVLTLLSFSGCKKYLEESNLGGRTAETYYNTAQGFEDLVKSNYTNLRPIFAGYDGLYFIGTDIFSSYNTGDNNDLNLYNSSFNSSDGSVAPFYNQMYYAINIANNTLYWATQVSGEPAGTLAIRIGETKALRALYYYLLVETFGDIPLVTTPTTAPTLSYTRTPESAIYNQIIQDLNDAIAVLPATTTDVGRMTLGAAQHLLSKIYLTHATKSYGSTTADYQKAVTLADAVIAGPYALKSTFSSLFDPTISNFQANNEVIFAVQYSTTTTTNGTGNNLNQFALWDTQSLNFIARSSLYGKPSYAVAPTPYLFTLFDKTKDSRYTATFWNVLYAQVAAGGFAVGDTAIYYPNTNLSAAQIASKKYYTINPDQYRTPFFSLSRSYPEVKKFREVNLPYQDNGGFRNTYVFRLAETYLIDAEANLQLGNTSRALQLFNAIRTRAANPGTDPATGLTYATELQATTLSIDDILDERARELFGEELRWFELKRTGKLISRTLAHNDEAKAVNSLDAHFLLRPIPQAQIDLNQGSFPQNPGY